MATDIAILERQFAPLAPRLTEALAGRMPVDRLIRTVMVSVERLPQLMECDRQSLFNAAMSAAVLGLEVDGVTGQAYILPFKGKAQLVIGYRGMNTLAARSGFTITGGVVKDGDEFDFELGDRAFVRHKPRLSNPERRVVAAWAVASAPNRTPIVSVLSLDDILAIKNRSPGAKRSDSPWNDAHIGFPAMAEKSAKRRLARSMPMNVMQLAARLDEAAEEQGKNAWLSPDEGVIIEGERSRAPMRSANTPSATELIGSPPPSPPGAERLEAPGPAFYSLEAGPGLPLDEIDPNRAYENFWDKTISEATPSSGLRAKYASRVVPDGVSEATIDLVKAKVLAALKELEKK